MVLFALHSIMVHSVTETIHIDNLVPNWSWYRKRLVPNWTCPCTEVVRWYRTHTFWNWNGSVPNL